MCACNGTGGDGDVTNAADTAKGDGDETTAAEDTTADGLVSEGEPVCLDECLFLAADVVNPLTGKTFGVGAQKLAPGESVSTKFTVTKGALAAVKVRCHSWNDNEGTLTLAIYAWIDGEGMNAKTALQDGYSKTVGADPILSQKFENFADNETLALYLDALGLDEGGTYLVVLTNPDDEDRGVGYGKSSFDGRTYYGELKYQLPDDLADFGYDPRLTANIVAFDTAGVPAAQGYANFTVEVMLPASQAGDYID